MEQDLGSALTGQDSVTLPRVDPAAASGQWDDWLQRPGNRTALLQMGLQMMQPVGIGQTVGGHIAQSVGAGAEAVDRRETSELKDTIATTKLAQADEKLRIAQQGQDSNAIRAGAYAAKAGAKKIGGLTDLMQKRFDREDAKQSERRLNDDAEIVYKEANDFLNPNSANAKTYKGKSQLEIRDMLLRTNPTKYGNGAAATGTSAAARGVIPDEPTADETDAPPVEGAQKAQDGNWYKPDPARPGKYLLVKR